MDELERDASRLIHPTYAQQGVQSIRSRYNLLRELLVHGKMPEEGLGEGVVEALLRDLAAMDSNNFIGTHEYNVKALFVHCCIALFRLSTINLLYLLLSFHITSTFTIPPL